MLNNSDIAILAAKAAEDRKADNILIIDVSDHLVITDYFLICSGSTSRQVKSIADSIREKLRDIGEKIIGVEGESRAEWLLLDYGGIVIHIFTEEQRYFYQLERLWMDAPELDWQEKSN